MAKNNRTKEVIELAQKTTSNKKIPVEASCIIIAASLLIGAIVFVLSYIGMKSGYFLGTMNQPTLHWMVIHRDNVITSLMKLITSLTNPMLLAPIIGIAAIIWAFTKKDLWRPIILVGAMVLALFFSTAIKLMTMDPRPATINMIPSFETDYSFPSGHTIGIATFLLVLGYLVYSRNFSTKNLTIWIIIASAGTALIASSRLYLGYHWLTDVLASLGLAMIILSIAVSVDLITYRKKVVARSQKLEELQD